MKKRILSVLLTLCMLLTLLPMVALADLEAEETDMPMSTDISTDPNTVEPSPSVDPDNTYTLNYSTVDSKYVTMSGFTQSSGDNAWHYSVQVEKGKGFEFVITTDQDHTLPGSIDIASGQVHYVPDTDFTYDPDTGKVEILASGGISKDTDDRINVYINATGSITTATQLQTALGGAEFAAVSGNTVTLQKDSAIADEEQLNLESANFTLDLGGYTLTMGSDAILGPLAGGGLILQNGTVAGFVMSQGTLTIKSGTYSGVMIGDGTTTIEGGTFESVMVYNPTNEYHPVLTIHGGSFTAGVMNMFGTLTIKGGSFGEGGLTVMGTTEQAPTHITAGTFGKFTTDVLEPDDEKQTLADCIAPGSKVYKYDDNTKGEELTGTALAVETYETPFLVEGPDDPNAFQPSNGGITYRDEGFFANGNAITLVAGKVVEDEYGELTYTKIYYTDDPEKKVIDLAALVKPDKLTGNTTDGFNLALKDIYGGSYEQAVETTHITALGGEVHDLYGGGYKAGATEANIVIQGGEQNTVYGGSSQSGDTKTVNLTVTGGEVTSIDPYRDMLNDDISCTVETINVTVTGGVIQNVSIGNVTNPSLTVGGAVKIGYIFLGSADGYDFVDSFTIDPDLGPSASVGLYFVEAPQSNTTVATSAKASDLWRMSIFSDTGAPVPYRLVLDGTEIKVVAVPVYAVSGTVTDENGAVDGAVVQLMRGNTQIGESVDTGADGKYSFTGVPAGAYNVVATTSDSSKTVTKLITVTDGDLTGQDLTLPTENKNSVLDVAGADTPAVVVGGLDKLAEDTDLNDASSVTVKLTVQEKGESADNAESIKSLVGGKAVDNFLDLKLEKTVIDGSSAGTTDIGSTNNTVLEIVIPYDFTGKKDVAVYRYHDKAEPLTKADTKADGTFRLDEATGLIYIYAAKFSTYAVAYTAVVDEPTPPSPPSPPAPPATSETDSSSSVTTYAITATAGQGGSISPKGTSWVNRNGSKTFTVKPDEGYVIADVLVDGVSVGAVASYTFEKVAAKHTIRAVFQKKVVNPFDDVAEDDWFYAAVMDLYEKGLMTGTDEHRFSPHVNIDRAAVVTVLWRAEGMPSAGESSAFPDVPTDAWYAPAVAWAHEVGVVKGHDTGKFSPMDTITREQLAAILYRYTQLKRMDTSATNDLAQFSDQPSAWAAEAMRWAVGAEIITGKGSGILDPSGEATRAQAAAMLMRFLEKKSN